MRPRRARRPTSRGSSRVGLRATQASAPGAAAAAAEAEAMASVVEVEDPPADLSLRGPVPPATTTRRFDTRGLSLRGFAAHGMLINTVFNVALTVLGLVRGVMLAAFLTRSDYGVWAVLGVTIGFLAQLKLIGVGDKYIQQDDADQELAFQQAFTVEVIVTAAVLVPLYLALPVVAVVYGQWSLVLPGAVVLLAIPATALQAPLWVFYREMEFMRARALQAVEPILGFAVTLGLAIAGAGYWALVIGVLAGSWASAIVAIRSSPYRLRWRFQRGVMKIYWAYSWPLFLATVTTIVLANSAALTTNVKLGLAGVGVVGLASNVTQFTTRADDIISGTLYPAICAVKDRVDLLLETFIKVNRLALMWAVPFGVGIALFAADLVRDVLGERWAPAIGLLQVTGAVAAIGHIGFNWDDYFRAEGDTKPILIAQVGTTLAFLLSGVPLTLAYGLPGLAAGIAVQAVIALAFRAYYLRRLFHGFAFLSHAVRALLPSVPAAALILLVRLAERGSRSLPVALAELLGYVLVAAGATWIVERELLVEAAGYLFERRRRAAA